MKLPPNWEMRRMDELGQVLGGKQLSSASHFGAKRPYLRVANVHDGFIDVRDLKQMAFSDAEFETFKLKQGDVVLTEGQSLELVGRPAIFRNNVPNCCFQNSIIRLRVGKQADARYAFFVCQHLFHTGRFQAIAKKTTSIAHLGVSRFATLATPVAPLREQHLIADILETWDSALVTTAQIVAAKERLYLEISQQLLTEPEPRIGSHQKTPFWISRRFGELFVERVETGRADLPLLAITADNGIVPRNSLEKRDTSATDKSAYLRICPGDIGYNTMRMWQGVSGLSSLEGIVSPAYTVVTPGPEIDGKFASYLLKFPPIVNLLRRYSQGLVEDTLNLKFPHFAQIRVKIPRDVSEQRRIAKILDVASTELRLLREQHAALAKQKRGLMQLLLTGKKRVRV